MVASSTSPPSSVTWHALTSPLCTGWVSFPSSYVPSPMAPHGDQCWAVSRELLASGFAGETTAVVETASKPPVSLVVEVVDMLKSLALPHSSCRGLLCFQGNSSAVVHPGRCCSRLILAVGPCLKQVPCYCLTFGCVLRGKHS